MQGCFNALRFKSFILIACIVLLAGCAKQRDLPIVGSNLIAIGPDTALQNALKTGDFPADFLLIGDPGAQNLRINNENLNVSLRAQTADESFSLVRRTKASVLANPYLSFTWRASPVLNELHPVHLIVGFSDKDKADKERQSFWAMRRKQLPTVDRLISIAWSHSALQRGIVSGPAKARDGMQIFRYIARGGPENADIWWTDTIDLSGLYRIAWPNADLSRTEVRFIGLSAAPTDQPHTMDIANLRLSR